MAIRRYRHDDFVHAEARKARKGERAFKPAVNAYPVVSSSEPNRLTAQYAGPTLRSALSRGQYGD